MTKIIELPTQYKKNLLKTRVKSIMLRGSETWIIAGEEQKLLRCDVSEKYSRQVGRI